MDTADAVMSAEDVQLVRQHRQRIAAEISEHRQRRSAAVRSLLTCKIISCADAVRNVKRNHENDLKWMMECQKDEIEELMTSHEKEIKDLDERLKKDLEEEMRELQWILEDRLPQRVQELMNSMPVMDSDEVEAESAPVADVLELAGFADAHADREDADDVVQLSLEPLLELHSDLEDADGRDVADDLANMIEVDHLLDHSFGSAATEFVTDEDEEEVDAEAAAAAAAAREAIKTLREQNEECTANGFRFSRACPICSDSPFHRAVFTSCGHSICLACAEEIKLVAEESEEIDLACPMCREEGGFVKLWEERMDLE